MADNLKVRRLQDRNRINVSQYHEVEYWTERFGCTKQQLLDAVRRVGNSADAVRRALGKLAAVRE